MNTSKIKDSTAFSIYSQYNKKINAIALILLVFLIGEIITRNFFNANTILQTVRISALIGIFAISQLVIMGVGQGVDVSTGHIATIAAVMAVGIIDGQNANLIMGVPVALGIGAFFGLMNGLGVVFLKIPSLLMTLAMGTVITGLMNMFTHGEIITGSPAPIMRRLFAQQSGPIPNLIFVWIVMGIIVWLLMYKTRWGSILLATGENPVTAKANGINVKLVTIMAFVISGFVAGFSGLIVLGYIGRAIMDLGFRYMFPSIAACVVGGISIWGGEGDYTSVMIGAVAMTTVRLLFYILGWGDVGRYLGYGIVLVAMVALYGRKSINER